MHPLHQLSRRSFLTTASSGAALALPGSAALLRAAQAREARGRWVQHDGALHRRCWMAWPSSRAIWGAELAGVQADIARIARTIAAHEPVVMCANPDALAAVRAACGRTVRCIDAIPVDDCWIRDSGPVFRTDGTRIVDAVGLNFNAWGHKQPAHRDGRVASRLAGHLGVPFSKARVVGEPGAIEADGDGTLLATDSSLINRNRNPGASKRQITAAMCAAYGARKVIWLPGIAGRDITDDHVDATSRFVRPGVVMVQLAPAARTDIWARNARDQARVLSAATDAKGRRLRVLTVTGPETARDPSPDLVDSYVNWYCANGAVIAAQFGDHPADAAAGAALRAAFPGRAVEQINIDHLARGGGGIHCVTQQQPAR